MLAVGTEHIVSLRSSTDSRHTKGTIRKTQQAAIRYDRELIMRADTDDISRSSATFVHPAFLLIPSSDGQVSQNAQIQIAKSQTAIQALEA
jgi:hypothetical protein